MGYENEGGCLIRMELERILVIIILSLIPIGFVAWAIIHPIRKNRELEDMKDEDFSHVPEPESIGATVMKKEITERKGKGKMASYKMVFEVLFLTDDGEQVVYELSEECYQEISEGQSGVLVTMNGQFFDFK